MAYDNSTKTFSVATDDELNAAIANIDAIGKAGNNNDLAVDHYTIKFTQSITLDGTSAATYAAQKADGTAGDALTINSGSTPATVAGSSQLYALNLSSGVSVTIEAANSAGGVFTLNGAGTYNGFFVYNGTVEIQNLEIANAIAKGGRGGPSSGGGAGLGGGLFVASAGVVTLEGVTFSGNSAVGGTGNTGGDGSAFTSGGGGLGGDGNNGGGGVGLGATGGTASAPGGAGILLGAGPGSSSPAGGANAVGGNYGGGGGTGNSGTSSGAGGDSSNNNFGGSGGIRSGSSFGGGSSPGTSAGFGGGSGAAASANSNNFGGGRGSDTSFRGGGGGGLGAGADIFVQQGGVLKIGSGTLGAGTVTPGAPGASGDGSRAGAAFGSGIFIQGNQTITLNPGAGQISTVDGVIADVTGSIPSIVPGQGTGTGAGALMVGDGTSTGTVVLSAANTYVGATTVTSGTLIVNGSIAASQVTVQSGATLGGTGTAGKVTVAAGGTLAPGGTPALGTSIGILKTGALALSTDALLSIEMQSGKAGTGYDQVQVTGTVDLTGAKLAVALLGNYDPGAGSQFVVIGNDGTDAVTGTFAGLAEGAVLRIGLEHFQITYQGGDGNDVVLTNVANQAPTTSAVTLSSIAEDSGARVITQAELLANAGDADDGRGTLVASDLTLAGGSGTLVSNGNGTWTYTPATNDDGAVSFTYKVSDGIDTVGGTASLDITPVNDAPTDVALSSATVAENAAGAIVGELSGSDVDASDALSFAVADAASPFTVRVVDGRSFLALKAGVSLDFEAGASRTVAVTAADKAGATYAETLTIGVQNVNEAPTGISLSNATVQEESAGAIVGTLSATDADGDAVTYTVNDSRFRVDTSSGAAVLRLQNGVALDYETLGNVNIAVAITASDGSLSSVQNFTIAVQDVNEAPAGQGVQNSDAIEQGATQAPLGIDPLTDPENQVLTYTVGALPGEGSVTLDGTAITAGQVLSAAQLALLAYTAPDNATGGTISFTASDGTNVTPLTVNLSITAAVGKTYTGTEGVDRLDGAALNDTLKGLGGDDTLIGGSGDDILSGGDGADTMAGGTGNDNYYLDNAADIVIEAASEGTDRVRSSVSYKLAAGQSVEVLSTADARSTKPINLVGNELSQTVIGNAGANTLSGGKGGDDTLIGLGGNDALWGGVGNDTLTGGKGDDSFVFNTALNAKTNVDVITDFHNDTGNNDRFVLENKVFAGLSAGTLAAAAFKEIAFYSQTKGVDGDDRILYDKAQGDLYFDRDGIGTDYRRVKFAEVADNTALMHFDFLIV